MPAVGWMVYSAHTTVTGQLVGWLAALLLATKLLCGVIQRVSRLGRAESRLKRR